jgi:HEAT repeat protein
MPLIRRSGEGELPPTASDPEADLRAAEPGRRLRAARALGVHPASVAALGRALGHETEPDVRNAILGALVRIGGEGAVSALLPYLRSDDAALRGGVLGALQDLPESLAQLPALLADRDPDIRVLAAEIARSMPNIAATELLCRMIEKEPLPNPCMAAVDVLAEIGSPDCLPALLACEARFGAEPFLLFAIRTTIARLSASAMTDP